MVRCGELCKSCGPICQGAEQGVWIACVHCGETGKRGADTCSECDGEGHQLLTECPRKFVGDISEAINIASLCGNGTLPVGGGLLDQSAWFLGLWQTLQSEEARIDNERVERINRGI